MENFQTIGSLIDSMLRMAKSTYIQKSTDLKPCERGKDQSRAPLKTAFANLTWGFSPLIYILITEIIDINRHRKGILQKMCCNKRRAAHAAYYAPVQGGYVQYGRPAYGCGPRRGHCQRGGLFRVLFAKAVDHYEEKKVCQIQSAQLLLFLTFHYQFISIYSCTMH